MAKTAPMAVDAETLLAQLTQRAAMLRDVANLAASHAELQAAAERGDLVCWNACKLHGPDGFRTFSPGEPMPRLDSAHALLEPSRRAVTTKQRWQARSEFKTLSGYLDTHEPVERRLRLAKAAQAAAKDEIARLNEALRAAQAKLREAEAERAEVENAMRSLVERAPVPA